MRFLREENAATREAVRSESEANRRLLTDTIKIISIPLAVLLAIAAWLGFKSFSDLKDNLRLAARQETDSEIKRMQSEIRNRLDEQFKTPALQKAIKDVASEQTKTFSEPLIRKEVASQVERRIDAEKVGELVRQEVEDRVRSQLSPVRKELTDLTGEADIQLLITKMNAGDARTYDSLADFRNSDQSKVLTVKSAVRAATDSYSNPKSHPPREPAMSTTDDLLLASDDFYDRAMGLEWLRREQPQSRYVPIIVRMATSDPHLEVRAAATYTLNAWLVQKFHPLDKRNIQAWWDLDGRKQYSGR